MLQRLRLLAALTLPLLLLLSGCAGAKRISHLAVAEAALPNELAAWKEFKQEHPFGLWATVGNRLYVLISFEACVPEMRLRPQATSLLGGGAHLWVEVKAVSGPAAWFTRKGEPMGRTYLSIPLRDIPHLKPEGLTAQQRDLLPIRLDPREPPTGLPEGTQFFLRTREPYCESTPIRRELPAQPKRELHN